MENSSGNFPIEGKFSIGKFPTGEVSNLDAGQCFRTKNMTSLKGGGRCCKNWFKRAVLEIVLLLWSKASVHVRGFFQVRVFPKTF